MRNGAALERFIRSRWGRSRGGIRGLATALHVTPDKIYGWFRDLDPAPDTDELGRLAVLLEVRRYEIVAAMDGEAEVLPLNDQTRSAFVALMDEWAVERGLLKPRPEHSTESGAA